MGDQRLFRAADEAANCGGFGQHCASVPTAAGTGPAFLFVECAVSAVRASVPAPSCFWLCDVRRVWQRSNSWFVPAYLLDGWWTRCGCQQDFTMTRANKNGVIERSLGSFVDALEYAFYSEALARKNGLLQKLDPRIKILALLPLIVIA